MGVEKGNKLEGLLEAQIFKALEDLVKVPVFIIAVVGLSAVAFEMNEDQCMYDTIMFEEVDTDDQNEQECGVNEPQVDYSDAFNTSQVFDSRDDVLQWAQSVAYENGLVAVIIRYRVPRFVGVTPTGMTFAAGFAYLEGEHLNNVVWALERFRGIFLRLDALPGVIVTDRDLALMNVVKTVFPECTNLLCSFHINENVKAKCKSLIGQKNAWEYVMDAWGSLVDCLSEQQFDECLKKFEMACSPWPMFVDYVNETWIISHKEKFVIAWTNKVMHLGNTTTNRVESAHWALKRVLQNSLGDLCSVWDAMNNMMTLQHTEIKASFETSTHVVQHVFKITLYRRLLGMVSRYALNQIAAEFERVHYADKNPSTCGCVMRTMHGLPCACELSKYVVGCIPLVSIHMFWRKLSFSDQGLSKPEVSIKEEMETISKRFEELDVCGKFTLKSKLWEIAYPDQNSMCPPPAKVNTKGAAKKPMNRNPRSTKRNPSY
ncbi:hypothetical protein HKD37_04G009963 [Glycine soja]